MKFNCGITGHSGVLGSELIKKNNTIKFIRFYGDIANKKHVKDWLVKRNINIIFHLAAIVPTKIVKKEPKKANKVNYLGTKILIDELITFSAPCMLVLMHSIGLYSAAGTCLSAAA